VEEVGLICVDYADDSFWCAAVAAITLKTLNPFGNGTLVLVSL
jgi:hypothetical protein